MKLIDKIKKGDALIVFLLIAVCIIWFLPKGNGETVRAEIYLDGETVHSLVLYDMDEPQTVTVGGCEILLEKDGVTFIQSQCSDKLCEKRGKMTNAGDTMACVPEKVVVALSREKASDFDSVAY